MASPVEPITALDGVAVTKSDTTIYNAPFCAIYVGGTGDVAVRTMAGTTLTFVGVPAGGILPIKCDKVMSTNTSATSIVGLRY